MPITVDPLGVHSNRYARCPFELIYDIRIRSQRSKYPSLVIVDAQSVSNADTARCKGYDAHKKISGIKRHVLVDTQGLPHIIHVTTAEVQDRQGALEMLANEPATTLCGAKVMLVDGGYSGISFASEIYATYGAMVQVSKRVCQHGFSVIPKRWVVERSFAWLHKCRRLWKNCERVLNMSLHMTVLAFVALLLRRLSPSKNENERW